MKKRCLSIGLTALSILMLTLSSVQTRGNVSAATPPPKTFAGNIPSAVKSGQARLIGHHLGNDHLALAIGLPLRNEQALTQFLSEQSTSRNTQYRHYLTQAQANQAFNPTPLQEQQVIGWLQSQGLMVSHTYPNHLLIDVTGTFAQIEQVFHVTINDYMVQHEGKQTTFYAPANDPTMDGVVGSMVNSILGLDDYPRFHVDNTLDSARPADNGKAHGSPPYYPQDFANAYDVNPLWNAGDKGVGQHIAITLPGTPPTDATLNKFKLKTKADVATQLNGRGRLKVIPVDGGSKLLGGDEAGMDIEYASGMAPSAIIDYYEMPGDNQNGPTSQEIDDALNMAGSDANNNQQISNSWSDGGTWTNNCEPSHIDSYINTTEEILAANSITGHDYFFASGDNGSACVFNSNSQCSEVQDPYPSYPASSAYVTSVGGTNLAIQNNSWQNEVAWNYSGSSCSHLLFRQPPAGSGGGYSNLFPEPTWQSGILDPNNQRGYPDIAADADPYTGAYVCSSGKKNSSTCTTIGGTSLATPLWAGMMADVNQYVQSQNEPPLGFINPLLYELAKGSPYTAYHDIKQGTNGTYNAGSGWDAVNGLGSPDLYNFARDAAILDHSAVSLTPIELDTSSCTFTPVGISDGGTVGGNIQCSSSYNYATAATWQNGSGSALPRPSGAGESYVAYGISSTGEVVGYAQYSQFHAVKWDSSGTATDLGGVPPSGTCDPTSGSTIADAENDVGDIAGYCWDANSTFEAGYWPGGTPNSFTKLPDISNAFSYSYAMGINHSRSIIGFAGFYDPNNAALGVVNHGVLWQNGTATDINPAGAVSSQPVAINDNNLAVGNVTFSETDPNNHAYVWDLVNNTSYDLYALTGYSAHATALNNSGVVVGDFDTGNVNDPTPTRFHAFMWKAGSGFVDLNNLLAADSGWTLTSAVGINSSGQIVGTGFYNGESHNYLLNVPLAALT